MTATQSEFDSYLALVMGDATPAAIVSDNALEETTEFDDYLDQAERKACAERGLPLTETLATWARAGHRERAITILAKVSQ